MKSTISLLLIIFCSNVLAMPWAEYDSGSTLVLSLSWFQRSESLETDLGFHGEIPVQLAIIKNVPKTTSLLLFVNNEIIQQKVRNYINNIRPDVQVRFIIDSKVGTTQDSVWVRDSFPLLVKDNHPETWNFISIENRWKINPELLNFIQIPTIESQERSQYGNILADNQFCYTHYSIAAFISDKLQSLIGCQKMITLYPEKGEPMGIGHIDERLKILSNSDVLTDIKSWKEKLEQYGKKVTLLPVPPRDENIPLGYTTSSTKFRSYLNSLILGNTIFVPVFGVSTDNTAIEIYKSFGYRVIPINSNILSMHGQGSLHCISATLPLNL